MPLVSGAVSSPVCSVGSEPDMPMRRWLDLTPVGVFFGAFVVPDLVAEGELRAERSNAQKFCFLVMHKRQDFGRNLLLTENNEKTVSSDPASCSFNYDNVTLKRTNLNL